MYVPIFFKIIILGKDVPLEDLSGEVRNGLTNNDDTTVITISESSNGNTFFYTTKILIYLSKVFVEPISTILHHYTLG